MLVMIEVLLVGAAILRLIKRSFDGVDVGLISLAAIITMMILAVDYLENFKEDSLRQNAEYLDNENDRLTQINRALVTINRIQENQLQNRRLSSQKWIPASDSTPEPEFSTFMPVQTQISAGRLVSCL